MGIIKFKVGINYSLPRQSRLREKRKFSPGSPRNKVPYSVAYKTQNFVKIKSCDKLVNILNFKAEKFGLNITE